MKHHSFTLNGPDFDFTSITKCANLRFAACQFIKQYEADSTLSRYKGLDNVKDVFDYVSIQNAIKTRLHPKKQFIIVEQYRDFIKKFGITLSADGTVDLMDIRNIMD